MANDIAAAISGNPINQIRAYVDVLPTGSGQYIVVGNAPAECDTITEIESKYSGRFEEEIIVGG